MILRLRICSRYLAIIGFLLVFRARSYECVVSGSIRLADTRDKASARDASGVVVWLEPRNADPPLPPHHVKMLQKDKRFQPHILVIDVNTTVDFPNLDPIFHSAFSNFDGQLFDLALYAPGSTRSVAFKRPGIVRVFCNIHPSMSAIIVVLDTPYFTVTKKNGQFAFPSVPDGEYQMNVFHERATPQTLSRATRTIAISGSSMQIPPLTISEAGYLPVPHKNKYGHDYPANADDRAGYSLPIQ